MSLRRGKTAIPAKKKKDVLSISITAAATQQQAMTGVEEEAAAKEDHREFCTFRGAGVCLIMFVGGNAHTEETGETVRTDRHTHRVEQEDPQLGGRPALPLSLFVALSSSFTSFSS